MLMIAREAGIAALGILLVTFPSEAGIKCWTNSEGVRECGNAVPPEYAQKEHRVLSEDGVVIDERKRAKSKKEIEQEEKLAREKAEQERLAREQAERDRVLLDTFSSEDDLMMARDGQLATIGSQIKLRESHLGKLKSTLDEFVAAAADMERRGEKPSDKVLQDIENVRRQIKESGIFIQSRRADEQALSEKFQHDLKRLRELRGEEP